MVACKEFVAFGLENENPNKQVWDDGMFADIFAMAYHLGLNFTDCFICRYGVPNPEDADAAPPTVVFETRDLSPRWRLAHQQITREMARRGMTTRLFISVGPVKELMCSH